MEGCFELTEDAAIGTSNILSRYPLLRSWVIAKYGSVQLQQSKLLLFDGVDKLCYDDVEYIPAIDHILEEYLLKVAHTDGVTKMEIKFTNDVVSMRHNGNCVTPEIDDEVSKYKPSAIFDCSTQYWEDKFIAAEYEEPTVEQIIFMLSSTLQIHIKDAESTKAYQGSWCAEGWEENVSNLQGMQNLSEVSFQLPSCFEETFGKIMKTRLIQIQATTGNELDIKFNGQTLNVKSFSQYVNMYPKKVLERRPEALPRMCMKLNDKLEVCITRSDGNFEQESFVNGTHTVSGGTLVDLLVKKIESHACRMDIVLEKDGIRNSMLIFINFSTDNPQFSLSNDRLLSKLDSELLSTLTNDDLDNCVRNITHISHKGNDIKTASLEDAEKAGGIESKKCTLILSEGASATQFVKSGLSYLGRDCHGILTLQGKLPNAFVAGDEIFKKDKPPNPLEAVDEIFKHEDLNSIVEALGLDFGVHYNNTNFLRYGHLMLMMDQDVDGSHIKGLIISFFAKFWPSLLKVDGFLSQFITPVVKAEVGGKPHDFYSTLEFNMVWQSNTKQCIRAVRYFKGLGTHTDADGKEYFTNKVKHNKIFKCCGEMDSNAIELVFSGKRANERKLFIKNAMHLIATQPQRMILHTKDAYYISYHDFIHKELVHYSVGDVWRSIPSFVDGLKTSQRKILCAALDGGLQSESQDMVYQFSGHVCKRTAYHHGGTSMETAIIGMAQNFVGKNNISLLEPKGQFGSRIEGTEGNAAARYLHLQLGRLTNLIFRKEDKSLLTWLHEDGIVVEPKWYLPVLPMCLVNGCDGIATGWSTDVPMFDPKVIIQNLLTLLNAVKTPFLRMRPHYVGFKGKVEDSEEAGVFIISGLLNEVSDTQIEIIDIPPTQKINEYKKFLASLTSKAIVKRVQELHEEGSIKFKVEFLNAEKLKEFKKNGDLLKNLRLISKISTRNMNLIDQNGVVVKFNSAEDIIRRFFEMRLPYYSYRKVLHLARRKTSLDMLSNKIRFLQEVRNHDFDFSETNLVAKLTDKGYIKIDGDNEFAHLLKIPAPDLFCTIDIKELSRSKDDLVDELAKLEKVTGVDLWIQDLNELLVALGEVKVTAPRDPSRKRHRSAEVEAISGTSSAPKRAKDSLQQERRR